VVSTISILCFEFQVIISSQSHWRRALAENINFKNTNISNLARILPEIGQSSPADQAGAG
jgi:hypothetical protein